MNYDLAGRLEALAADHPDRPLLEQLWRANNLADMFEGYVQALRDPGNIGAPAYTDSMLDACIKALDAYGRSPYDGTE